MAFGLHRLLPLIPSLRELGSYRSGHRTGRLFAGRTSFARLNVLTRRLAGHVGT
jgi:hypothetical protein